MMMSPRWGYWDVAPMGLLGCRPDGVIGISPLRGYRSPSEAEESEVEESMPYNFSSGKPTTL
jgi:hypothetical protein